MQTAKATRTHPYLTVGVPGLALLIFGALWATCAGVSGLRFPVAGYGAANLFGGLALIVTGGLLVWRARVDALKRGAQQ